MNKKFRLNYILTSGLTIKYKLKMVDEKCKIPMGHLWITGTMFF